MHNPSLGHLELARSTERTGIYTQAAMNKDHDKNNMSEEGAITTNNSMIVELEMEPTSGKINLAETALLIIDMQRDFLEPNGFGEMLGNDVSKLQRAVEPCRAVLQAVRSVVVVGTAEGDDDDGDDGTTTTTTRMLIVHTREGHRSDMADVHAHKQKSGVIGSDGPMGRILIRGSPGHDIIPELYPAEGAEPIIDKPGKGSFYATDLECILQARRITTLLVCGVTTEVCVHTTVREANDRGYHCIVVSDCCASYRDDFHATALRMIAAQGGIFGSVSDSTKLLAALRTTVTTGTLSE